MVQIPEIEVGTVFNKIGSWYSVIEEVLKLEGTTALIKAHADDGFIEYWVFEYEENKGWMHSYKSSDLEAMEYQFKLSVNYKK